jgi:hypothetical protein
VYVSVSSSVRRREKREQKIRVAGATCAVESCMGVEAGSDLPRRILHRPSLPAGSGSPRGTPRRH